MKEFQEIKVALVHDYFMQYGGAERVFEVLYEIFPDADVFCPVVNRNIIDSIDSKMNLHTSRFFNNPIIKKYYRVMLLFYPIEIEKFDLSGYDLVISDSSGWVKNVIIPPGTKHISYIYNPMRFLWNYFHQDLHKRNTVQRLILSPIMHFLRIWDYIGTNRIDKIITISKHVIKRIEKYYGKKADLIYPYVDTDFYRPSNYKGDYFLLVSRFRPYKKVDLAIKAFNRTGDKLLIIGRGEKEKEYRKMAKPNIIFLNSVDDDHLREYYASCRAFIFPQEEDFGITPLEAQSCGRPVIAFAAGGALETITDGVSGLFFSKQTVSSLANVIERFKKVEHSFKKAKVRESILGFSRNNFKKQFVQQIELTMSDSEV